MKVLINTPLLYLSGGVANHYLGLRPYWKENVKYNEIGRRRFGNGLFWLIPDLLKFIYYLLINKPNLVILNPSFAANAIKRDSIFLAIAKLFKTKCIVFFHGWDSDYSKRIDKNWFLKKYNKADAFILLAKEFKIYLISIGVTKPIELSLTKVDDRLLHNFNINKRNGQIKNILFLSRIEKEKGIFIVLKAFKSLKKNSPYLNLTIVGDGKALIEAKLFAEKEKISGVTFTGKLSGAELINEYNNADLYFFPTYHGEGLPTSLLEAMAFGLPIITRPVGGIKDFFINVKMGYAIDSKDEKDFIEKIELLMNDKELCNKISHHNHYYAINNFLASKISKNLESIFYKYCQ